jgi:hypothetical protein
VLGITLFGLRIEIDGREATFLNPKHTPVQLALDFLHISTNLDHGQATTALKVSSHARKAK